MSILKLPFELLILIARELSSDIEDISALSRSCRTLHNVVTPILYKYVKDDPNVLCWAVDEGRIRVVERLLAAGADPNVGFLSDVSRAVQLKHVRHFNSLYGHTLPLSCHPFQHAQPRYGAEEGRMQGIEDGPDSHDDDQGQDCCEAQREESNEGYYDTDSDEDLYDALEDEEENGSSDSSDEEDEDDESESSSNRDLSFTRRFYWSPLHIAARWGLNDIVELLLRHGADIHALSRGFCNCSLPTELADDADLKPGQYYPLWMPLHTAICFGNDSTARLLLSLGASTNISTRYKGWEFAHITALHSACFSDLFVFSRYLIESGCQIDVDVKDHMGYTPMSYAYQNGNWASMDFLLEQTATLDVRLGCFSLIKHACYYGRYAEAARLLELGVDVNANFEETEHPMSALYLCCLTTRSLIGNKSRLQVPANYQTHLMLDVIKTLITMTRGQKADPDFTPEFLQASKSHLPEVVQLLLDEGADVNACDSDGLTALQLACASHTTQTQGPMLRTVQILLPRINVVKEGPKALEKLSTNTARNRDTETIAQLLLENGAAPSLGGKYGQRLLSSSIVNGNFQLSEAFIEAGLRIPNSRELKAIIGRVIAVDNMPALKYLLTKFPNSAPMMLTGRRLFDSLKGGKEASAMFLAARGAPIDFRQDGETCLFHACSFKDPSIAEMLLERGADPNAYTDAGDYPMLFAILNDNDTLMTRLLDRGATIHQHPDGQTTLGPLDFAITTGNINAVDTMISHRSYWDSRQEERDDHLLTACFTGATSFGTGGILHLLLRNGDANPNVVFKSMSSTPLHLAIMTENRGAIGLLMRWGGDIHRKPVHADAESPPFARGSVNPLLNTTPMEFALRHGSIDIVVDMMDGEERFPDCPDVPLAHYMRAVCHRHKPDILALILGYGVDVNIHTEDGNTPLIMLCQGLDEYADDEDWEPTAVAKRSTACIRILLEAGIDVNIKNNKGESGLDYVRRRMAYTGTSEYSGELARLWNQSFIISEGSLQKRPLAGTSKDQN